MVASAQMAKISSFWACQGDCDAGIPVQLSHITHLSSSTCVRTAAVGTGQTLAATTGLADADGETGKAFFELFRAAIGAPQLGRSGGLDQKLIYFATTGTLVLIYRHRNLLFAGRLTHLIATT